MTRTTDTEAAATTPWGQPRSSGSDGRTSLMFWLAMLVLGVFAWGSVTWGASNLLAKKGPEKLLRVDLLLPKLNFSQGDRKAVAFHTSEPKSSEQAKKESPTTGFHLPNLFGSGKVKVVETPNHVGPKGSTAEPPLGTGAWLNPVAKSVTPPPIAVDSCHEPVVYLQPCTAQPGDSPMIRNWKAVTMFSVLTAATASLAPPPLLAQEDKGIVDKTDALKKLQRSVDTLIERIDALEKKKVPPSTDKDVIAEVFRAELKAELRKLEDGALSDIRKDIKSMRSDLSTVQAEQVRQKRDLDDLAFRFEQLNKKVIAAGNAPSSPLPAVDRTFMEEFRTSMRALQETIAKLGPTKERTSAYPNGAAPFVNTGRVALVNAYSENLLYIVNGVGYNVPARSSKIVDNVPTGALRYEVFSERWGTLENRVTSLDSGGTFTVTASNPR